jgi:hypothetical protein
MRNGDFGVEVVAAKGGRVRETSSGHVLARPGQVYRLRLRNFGPLRCVTNVKLDGRAITAGGLVLEPYSSTDLERPVDGPDDGCFTVIAEGDEKVFGPDGGRDNLALGLIDARFRRELPHTALRDGPPIIGLPRSMPPARPLPDFPSPPSRFPEPIEFSGLMSRSYSEPPSINYVSPPPILREPTVERAAGTGLTGHSDQRFTTIHLGPLEPDATVIELRLVIGTEASIAEDDARPLAESHAPSRPAARP